MLILVDGGEITIAGQLKAKVESFFCAPQTDLLVARLIKPELYEGITENPSVEFT